LSKREQKKISFFSSYTLRLFLNYRKSIPYKPTSDTEFPSFSIALSEKWADLQESRIVFYRFSIPVIMPCALSRLPTRQKSKAIATSQALSQPETLRKSTKNRLDHNLFIRHFINFIA
jgi:hypothetical protein